MEENSKTKPLVKKITFVPRWANILGGLVGLIILFGIAESAYFFKLNLVEITIMAIVLMIFYVIILAVILRPRTILLKQKRLSQVKKEVEGKAETKQPITININNQTKVAKKKTTKKKKK